MNKKNISTLSIIIIIMTVLIIILFAVFAVIMLNSINKERNKDPKTIIIDSGFIDIDVANEDDALKVIKSVDQKVGIADTQKELKLQEKNTSGKKTVYVMQQYYKNIPVYQHFVKLFIDVDRKPDHIESKYYQFKDKVSTEKTVSVELAEKKVAEKYRDCTIKEDPELVFYIDENGLPFLSWLITIKFYDTDEDTIVFIKMNDKNSDEDIIISDEDPGTKNEEKRYKWVVEPNIEADDIITANELKQWDHVNDYSISFDYGGNDTSRAALIYKDGNYSFIKYDGEIIPVPQATGYTYVSEVHKFMLYDNDNGIYSLMSDYSVNNEPWGTESNLLRFFWDDETSRCYYTYGQGPSKLYTPENVTCPVQKCTIETTVDGYEHCQPVEGSQYAICSDGDLLTDFKFDYAYMLNQDISMVREPYVIPCQKNGKWGYYNSDGEEILSFEYEPSYRAVDNNNFQDNMVPYLDSEGLINIQNESGAGYSDLNGNIVISLGEFEQTRPFFNGRAWVKKDGKWGVIRLSFNDHDYVASDIKDMIEQHYNDLYEDDGNYVVLDNELVDQALEFKVTLRYQMSDSEAQERRNAGKTEMANVIFKQLRVDKKTGAVVSDDGTETWNSW